jgi:hypothetical protein
MRVKLDTSAWRRTKWYEYLIRFAVGGAITVAAALIGKRFGAGIGGLFLAFPAIFPSTATLIASHEKKKKAKAGESGDLRARKLAGADAAGAAMGGVGLAAFAAVTWLAIEEHRLALTLATATVVWALTAFLVWEFREECWRWLRRKFSHPRAVRVERPNISYQGNRRQN